jgi:hypothetical protein
MNDPFQGDAPVPDLKIPEGSKAVSRWEAQRAHRLDPLPIANRTPEGGADPAPATTSPGTVLADSGATTTAEEPNPAVRSTLDPVNPVHPVLPNPAVRDAALPSPAPIAAPADSPASPLATPCLGGAINRHNPETDPAASASAPGKGTQVRVAGQRAVMFRR